MVKKQKDVSSRASRRQKGLLSSATLLVLLSVAFPCSSKTIVATWHPGSVAQPGPSPGALAGRPAKAPLAELNHFDQLRHLFQSDRGKVRLVSILSPT